MSVTSGAGNSMVVVSRRSAALPIAALATILLTSSAAAQGSLRIGGFDAERGGEGSVVEDQRFEELRASALNAFPDSDFIGGNTLSADYLATVDVLILDAVYLLTGTGIEPLTSEEQAALRQFVLEGGVAMLFADNTDFADAGQSLVGPFGITVDNFYNGHYNATIADPYAHPVTQGPYGVIESMRVAIFGEFTDSGPDAEPFLHAEVDAVPRTVGAIIEPGELGLGSGLVLAFADSSMLFDAYRSPDTTELVLNALHIAAFGNCRVDVSGDGVVDTRDVLQFLGAWVLDDPTADWNADGTINTQDFLAFLNDWVAGCP